MIEIIFLGRGGQGAFTSSRILGIAASLYEKKYSLSVPSFGPERRGAPVFAYTKISEAPIRDRSQSVKADYFVVLDESLYTPNLLERLKENGKLLLNTETPEKYSILQDGSTNEKLITFDALPVAQKYLGRPITNTTMLAALVSHSELVTLESLKAAVHYDLAPKIAEKNERLITYFETIKSFEKGGKQDE